MTPRRDPLGVADSNGWPLIEPSEYLTKVPFWAESLATRKRYCVVLSILPVTMIDSTAVRSASFTSVAHFQMSPFRVAPSVGASQT